MGNRNGFFVLLFLLVAILTLCTATALAIISFTEDEKQEVVSIKTETVQEDILPSVPNSKTYIIEEKDTEEPKKETKTSGSSKATTSPSTSISLTQEDEGEFDREEDDVSNLEDDVEESEDDLDDIEDAISDAEDDNDIEDIEDDLDDLHEDVDDIEDEIDDLKDQLEDENDDDTEDLVERLEDLEDEIDDLNDDIDAAEAALSAKQQELEGEGTDTDGDGVLDASDVCSGYDDTIDTDGDGTPDGCDSVDNTDSDNDGVLDTSDICSGYDDNVDTDSDGTPDGCDSVDNTDSDSDGVLDTSDICEGYDDSVDTDGDGTPDGCDSIDNTDSDGDGVIDSEDICSGYDDAIDTDGDGTPDGCDNEAPSLTTDCGSTATVGTAYTCTATGSDSDGDIITYSVSGVSGITIDSSSGAISWTPTTSQIGTQTFTVTVTDDASETGTISVSVIVSGSEIEELLAAIDSLEDDVDDINDDIADFSEQITEDITDEEILLLLEQLSDFEDEVSDLEDTLDDLYDDFEDIDDEDFDDAGVDQDDVEDSLDALSDDIEELYDTLDEIYDELYLLYYGYSYELCNEDLYFGVNISSCEGDVTEDEFGLLSTETYEDTIGTTTNSVSYTQTIAFQNENTGQFVFTQDDDDAPDADAYIFMDNSNNYLYNYSLIFDSPVLFDATSEATAENDLVGTTLIVQGETYTLIDVSLSDMNSIDELSLIPGITENTDICAYTIDLLSTTSESSTNFGIDNTEVGFNSESSEPSDELEVSIDFTALLSADDVEIEVELTGLDYGVVSENEYLDEVEAGEFYTQTLILNFPWNTENDYTLQITICPRSGDCATGTYEFTVEVEELDTCELATDMIRLRQGDETQSGYVDVDGTFSLIDSSEGELNGFSTAFAPDTDEVYLASGDEYVDPVFGQFSIYYDGIYADFEELLFIAGSTSAELRFYNYDGTYVEIPLAADSSYTAGEAADEAIFWGNEAPTSTTANQDELLYLEGESCLGSASVVDCQGAMFLVIDGDGNAHVTQITNIDINDNEINFDDLTYGTSGENVAYTDGAVSDISTDIGTIQLLIDETTKTITFTTIGSTDGAMIITYNLASLEIVNTDTTAQTYEGLTFSEYNDGLREEDKYLVDLEINAVYDDATDNSIEWDNTAITSLDSDNGFGVYDESDTNDDIQNFVTYKGTLIEFDRLDQSYIYLLHSYEAVYGVVTLESN